MSVSAEARRYARAVLRPLAVFVPVFVLGSFVTFLLGVMSGVSPAHFQLGESATTQAIARIEHEWGLDRPFLVQYSDWFSAVVQGDLGRSWYNGRDISTLLASRAGISLSVAALALVFGVVNGLVLGATAAFFETTWVDRAITAALTFVSVMPAFVVGIVLVALFAVTWQLLPAAGYVPLDEGADVWLAHIVLPAVALSFDATAETARQLRVGLVSAYRENYVTGALLRGYGPARVFFVHVLRNAAGPALAMLGMKFPNLLGGAVVTEAVFGLAGYGRFASDSALRGDVPAVQGALVVSVFAVVVFNLLVNVLLNRLNPAAERGA